MEVELPETLLRILEILAAEGTLQDQLARVHHELWNVMDASNLYVALHDAGSGLYFFPYSADPDDQDFAPNELRKSLTDYVRRTGRSLLCTEDTHRALRDAGEVEVIGFPAPVWLGAPLVTDRGTIGVVVVQHYTNAEAISERDVPTLERAARCMAVAVERSWRDERARVAAQMRLRDLQLSRDEAVRASQAKSRFLANMSHELRTPLNAIVGYTDLLLESEHERAADPQLSADLRAIRDSARHLRELIDGVLDLTQVESGHLELHPTRFRTDELLEALETQVAPLVAQGGNRLLLRPGNLGELHTDRRALFQALLNLVGNACKFTRDGQIVVRAKRRGEHAVFEISDTGTGIDPEKLPSLFEPFTTGDQRPERDHGGSGLGLPIARGLAQALGGTLEAASVPGRGSTFTITVPAGLP